MKGRTLSFQAVRYPLTKAGAIAADSGNDHTCYCWGKTAESLGTITDLNDYEQ